MNWGIDGKAAMITGAGRGIGKAIALGFANSGVHLCLTDIDSENLEAVASEARAFGVKVVTAAGDISKVETISRIFDKAVASLGHIDILVNVAGINTTTPLVEYTEEVWDRQMAVNLRAVLFTSQAAAKVMIPRKAGKIVNISSTSGFVASTNPKAAYDVSKAGVRHMTVSLGKELGRLGINVNSVAPGTITTEMTEDWLSSEENKNKSLSRIPLGRIGTPDDVVGAVLFLSSPFSDYVLGHTLVVDGGWLL